MANMSLIGVLQPHVAACGSRRFLDYIYGPMAKQIRRDIVECMRGTTNDVRPIPLSDKRCQYGNLRKALLTLAGVTGECAAAEDSAFQEVIDRVFAKKQETTFREGPESMKSLFRF